MVGSGAVDVSFLLTVEADPAGDAQTIAGTDIPDGYACVPIGWESSRICFGVPAEANWPDKVSLCEMATATFLSPARQSHDAFRKSFSEACSKAGFKPKFNLVPVRSFLEFYAKGSEDCVYILTESPEGRPPYIWKAVHNSMRILRLDEELRCVAHMVYRSECTSEAMRAFVEAVRSLG